MSSKSPMSFRLIFGFSLVFGLGLFESSGFAQEGQTASPRRRAPGLPEVTLPSEPFIINTHQIEEVQVEVVVRGLDHPGAMAFLPDGTILVTERRGTLRIIRDGVLDSEPIQGVPTDVLARGLSGMMEVVAHPDFEENHLVYLTYTRQVEARIGTVAVIRGRLEGMALKDVEDVFVAESWGGSTAGSRIVFAPDGLMFVTLGGAFGVERPDGTSSFGGQAPLAQDGNSYAGKVLRMGDDGRVPADNPFVGRDGFKPEIYSMGHRNQQGIALHPDTGEPWAIEHAPQGGDELNVIRPGLNYGWPVVSYGRHYDGPRIAPRFWHEGMEEPTILWVPSIAPSGMTFYTGDRFPQWKGNLFVGSLMTGRISHTGHIERFQLTAAGEELGREWILGELRQRIRDIRQGPDELLYVLTEENDAAILRLSPVSEPAAAAGQ